MSFLNVNNLSANYGKEDVIKDVSFSVEQGTITGVIGANGSGKSTLLKAMCGILPHKGTCVLDNESLESLTVKQLAKVISYIPQRSGISIDISVLDVVLMGFNPNLKLLERPNPSMKSKALQALEKVGLSGKEHTNYLHLSEGQKQLCILARTLVSDSKLLLLDEPESAMDFKIRYSTLSLLIELVSAGNKSAVVTLHDPMLALNYCDKLILLYDGNVSDIIELKKDSIEEMERKLCKIYGNISLHKCNNKKGEAQLIMLREDEI